MERKTIIAILSSLVLMILLGVSFLYFHAVRNYRATYRTNAFFSESERVRFKVLLHKHGLDHDVSAVYDWDKGKPYFYRDGKRCRFS
jgi:hypothetical protein